MNKRSFALLAMVLTPYALATPVPFNIPAGPASKTLMTFLSMEGPQVDLLFNPARVSNTQTHAVSGLLEPRQALKRMTRGTGLRLVVTSATSFVVDLDSRSRENQPKHRREIVQGCKCIVLPLNTITPWCDDGGPKLGLCPTYIGGNQ